ncbi:MAG TPA: glucose-6-phosphate dehydrogenase assembly protein OpcA [Ktedonobacterales bacterium]
MTTPHVPLRPVPVNGIETGLSNLWREAAAGSLAAGGTVVARNCALTLVVFTGVEGNASSVVREVEQVSGQYAMRAIVLRSLGHMPKDTTVASQIGITQRDDQSGSTHGEVIMITTEPDQATLLPGTVLPLILAEQPSFLLWTGEPPWRSDLFESLVDGCDRLIIDTSDSRNAEKALVALNDLQRRKHNACIVTDLNWTRLSPWTELMAQFFDTQDLRPYLGAIDRLTIEYAADTDDSIGNSAQAYLFAGWMASRLNWETSGQPPAPAAGGGRGHTALGNGVRIQIELLPRPGVPQGSWLDVLGKRRASDGSFARSSPGIGAISQVGFGALMSVHVHAKLNGQDGVFAIAREQDLWHASTHCSAGQVYPAHTVSLGALGEMFSIEQQLRELYPDQLFEESLSAAARILGPHGVRRTP